MARRGAIPAVRARIRGVRGLRTLCLLLVLSTGACDGGPGPDDAGPAPDGAVGLEASRAWTSDRFEGCTYASPLLARHGEREVILAVGDRGTVRGLDPADGSTVFETRIEPSSPELTIEVLATPGLFRGGHAAVLGWQELDASRRRAAHRARVLDVDAGDWDDAFAPFALAGSVPGYDGSDVTFESTYQLWRSAIHVREVPDRTLGLAYLSLGNGPSIQPYHGWIFEVDLDAWAAGDDPVSARFTTTAENDCGPDGNREIGICGGGIWNAAGVQIRDTAGGYEILAATGNGRIDLDRNAYAYSVVRLGRGLSFDRGCDEALCADFDELDPSDACLESCADLFVPRLEEGQVVEPEDGICDGMTFQECLHALDGDLGASMPVVVQPAGGPEVLVQPGKDGALYLVDHEHLGRMYQRLQLMDFCGTPDDPCDAFWIGTLVTRPAATTLDGHPVVVVASVMADRTHPSGISALRVVMRDGEPRLELLWQVPRFDSPEARESFRTHPGFPVIVERDGEPWVFVVETSRNAPPGILWGVRLRDGYAGVREPLDDAGQRFVTPLVTGERIVVSICDPAAEADGRMEAFDLVRSSAAEE